MASAVVDARSAVSGLRRAREVRVSSVELRVLAAPAAVRVALRVPDEAAGSLGMSVESFDRYVRPELRLIRRGRLVLVAVSELQRWVEAEAALTIEVSP